jgi:oligoribonuclease NrnB/cAMP/cGMP phosphodiesterase (DHH superfamily)
MIKYNYAIFHKGCLDGFSGFFILHTTGQISEDARIFPDVPSAKIVPPNIAGKDVIIIDVAYSRDILKGIMSVAKSVVFIDHHVTIRDDVRELKKELDTNKNITIVYNEKKSGASLTWEFFYPKKKVPLFIKYVEDNDTGAWKMKDTLTFIGSLDVNYSYALTPDNMKRWKKLFNTKHINELIKKGKIYEEYTQTLLEYNSRKYSTQSFPSQKVYDAYPEIFKKVGQYKVAVYCGSGCPKTTLLGLELIKRTTCDFVIMWVYHIDRKEYVLSMRSRDADVGSICHVLGGGGHKLAAACSFPSSKFSIDDLFVAK